MFELIDVVIFNELNSKGLFFHIVYLNWIFVSKDLTISSIVFFFSHEVFKSKLLPSMD